MNAREHLNFVGYSITLLGAGFGAYKLGVRLNANDILLLCVGGGVGSLLPDIDHKNGTLSKLIPLYILHNIMKKCKVYIFKHGGITHTILVNVWIFILAYIYKSLLVAGIAIGCMTHLYIDNLTGNKLDMLWWPLKNKKGWFKWRMLIF